MIKRALQEKIIELSHKLPVIAIIGPRQAGKTTLARETFSKHIYLSMEDLALREYALSDPRAFFNRYANEPGIIIDEIQEAPALLSYIQLYADEYEKPGYFVLTGSQNFLVLEAITQTLAGRLALFTLLPLSISELAAEGLLAPTIEEAIFKGSYPRIYARDIDPKDIYPTYIRTYIERDVRTIRNITDLSGFQRFLGLCAGRIGQLLNVSSLANDCGITVATAKAWLSVLEASFIIFLLQPYHVNIGKRLVKTPKLYFYDTGVACSVLGIESSAQLATHYLRGGLFESFIVSDLFKQRFNQGLMPRYYFWRDKIGNEVDCLLSSGATLIPIEMKINQTPSSRYFDGITYWESVMKETEHRGIVVYAGEENQERSVGTLLGWRSAGTIVEKI